MGCCCSSEEDKYAQDERNERERLLANPISDNSTAYSSARDGYGTRDQPGQPSDEQSKLNQILQDTANNVIDVSAIDSHVMEHNEFSDKENLYCSVVARLSASGGLASKLARPCVVDDGQAIHVDKLLSQGPLPLADVQMIMEAARANAKALENLEVEHKQELVVAFGIP